jgi:S-formylglutathione hydrolase
VHRDPRHPGIALANPGRYRSCSAFAPIVAPSRVPWGQKAFSRYLGEDRAAWAAYDACELLRGGRRFDGELLIDQGLGDRFLERELRPELIEAAAGEQRLALRRHAGYDHSYYFVSTFVEDRRAS